jgi:hypothetical protein
MKYLNICFLILLYSCRAFSQELNLEEFLTKAEKASKNYVETFKNLVAEETKTTTTFKNDGSVDDTRIVKSNFIVYQSEKSPAVSEFRTVFEYNGKNVAEKDDDVVKFFQKLSKSDNSSEEFRKVKNQSLRFDGRFRVWGMTLGQDFLLGSEVRKIFDYKFLGTEKIDGRGFYWIEYKQKEYSYFIQVNSTKEEEKLSNGFQFDTQISNAFQPTNPRLKGKMLLDSETGQMLKNTFTVEINPKVLDKSIITNESSYEYQRSKFGILIPKTISITAFRVLGKSTKDDVRSIKFSNMTAEYSKFTSLDTEAKDYKADKKPQ